MYMYQCEGFQMGQSSGVLLQEVAAFQRCPLIEVSLYIYTYIYIYIYISVELNLSVRKFLPQLKCDRREKRHTF